MLVDIEKIKYDIVNKLKAFQPEKIILFGSYAYGTPNKDSDIDLFIFKDIAKEEIREYKLKIRKELRSLIRKYGVGFDILVASSSFVHNRDDYFYKVDILQNGKVIYE